MPRVKLTNRQLLRIEIGGEVEDLLFDPGKMLLSETIAVEKATQWSWPQIIAGLNAGAVQAIRGVVWVMRKRSNPRLKIDDVEFSMEAYTLLDPDEEEGYWVLASDNDPDEETTWVGDDAPEVEPTAESDSEPEDPKDSTPAPEED